MAREGQGERPPKNVTAVGGVVLGPEGILLVKMTYGSLNGQYSLPGGIVDPGETLDRAVEREVLEETGVTAAVRGICAVRTRHEGPDNDTYVLFLLDVVDGTPRAHGRENDDARYFGLEELDELDVSELSRSMGAKALRGELTLLTFAEDFDYARAQRDPTTWRLYR